MPSGGGALPRAAGSYGRQLTIRLRLKTRTIRWSRATSASAKTRTLAAAAQVIGAIARHIEIPSQHAGAKWMSYQDAKRRVAAYDAARDREFGAAHLSEAES